MIVVSDTSPIINLAMIGHLDLLHQLYTDIVMPNIVMPSAVYQEIVVGGVGMPGAAEVQTQPWFHQRSVADTAFVALLRGDLDEGEAEAVALAHEIKADLLLIDEQAGRRHAARLGLKFIGLLGVLLAAKDAGILPAVKGPLDDLVAKAGFSVRPSLYAAVLKAAGE
jgi:predicted nucleic acid-binding protein